MRTMAKVERRKAKGVVGYSSLFPFLFSLGYAIAAGTAMAQPYPARPVRLVVGFTAGGATDIAARVLAQKLSETIGQPVVVENRHSAGRTLAAEAVARIAARRHT